MRVLWSLAAALLLPLVTNLGGCESSTTTLSTHGQHSAVRQAPYVIALGNLRDRSMPTQAETTLSEFLFGTQPEAPVGLVRPAGIAVVGGRLLICDTAMNTLFVRGRERRAIEPIVLDKPPDHPRIVGAAQGDTLLIVDGGANAVLHYDRNGNILRRYTLSGQDGRPSGVLHVENEVWVSDAKQHRIEIFDGPSGGFKKSIGRRGAGPGEFAVPVRMARGPNGHVWVVDVLNNRVQELDA